MGLFDLIETRRRAKERRRKAANAAKIIAGVGVGAALGVLFAPKSGKKTREDIANAAKEGIDFVSENVNTAMKAIRDKSEELKDAVVEKYDKFSNKNIAEAIPENIDKLEEKIEETKEKVKKKAKIIKRKAKDVKEKAEEKVKEAK
ncbi:MAG: YtxH domain-containing protein [Fusobacterium sp.]|uniref:YtxH domain-containing protein n=1 Tax=Fusobacterium sp. TaxID=68766 RepID=UPI0026DD0B57|nr:YtxH domain-containing protein [Fusobacterium sp.]MDO4690096.1 YtxH domain-containing protein [Fusobacterium sp.]